MVNVSDRQLRIAEILGRYLLVIFIAVFVVTAFGTYLEIQSLQTALENGQCGFVRKNIELSSVG